MNTITRREFLQRAAILGLSASTVALLNGCGLTPAPTPTPKIYRIGFLSGSIATSTSTQQTIENLRQALRELGWVEGQNIIIELRFADGYPERLPDLAAELIALKVDIILVRTSEGAYAAMKATTTIPIVLANVAGDYVALGFVASLAHPGGNVTGINGIVTSATAGKRVELFKEAVPGISRISFITDGNDSAGVQSVQETARAFGLQLQILVVKSPDEIEGFLAAALRERADALLVGEGPIISVRRPQIVDYAAKNRLPAMYSARQYMDSGGLMFYGAKPAERRWAVYIDKILKGAKPADLPVELPTEFDFVINLKTAKTLGLTIPQSVLAQATEVVQ